LTSDAADILTTDDTDFHGWGWARLPTIRVHP
jgi:hypothetical protein